MSISSPPAPGPAPSRRDVDLDEVHAQVVAAIDRESGPVAWLRNLSTARRIGIVLGAIALAVLLPRALVQPSAEAAHIHFAGVAVAAVYGVVLFALVRLALAPMQAPASTALSWLMTAGLVAPFFFCPLAPGGSGVSLGHVGSCFLIGLTVGWVFVALLWSLDRGAHRDGRVAGLAAGVAGVTASFGLQFDCSDSGAAHRLLCHATIGATIFAQYLLAQRLAQRLRGPRVY